MDNHDFQPGSHVPRGDSGTARVGARYPSGHGEHGAMAIRLLNRALAIAQAAARRCECQYARGAAQPRAGAGRRGARARQ